MTVGGVHHVQSVERAGRRPAAGAARRTPARPRRRPAAGRAGARQRQRVGLDREPELAGQPRQSQRAQRVALKAVGRDRPQPARAADPAARRTDRPASRRRRAAAAIALIVRSRRSRSASIDSPSSGSRSTCQLRSCATTRQAPNASESANANAARRAAECPRHALHLVASARPPRPRRSRRSGVRAAGRAAPRRPATRRPVIAAIATAAGRSLLPAPRRGDSCAAPGRRCRTGPRARSCRSGWRDPRSSGARPRRGRRSSPWSPDAHRRWRRRTHVDGDVVHAHRAHDRVAPATDQHVAVVAQRAPDAVARSRSGASRSRSRGRRRSGARTPRCRPAGRA